VDHTPYGYIIQNGKAVIDEMKAVQVRDLYQAYLSELSLRDASKKAGINRYHATVAKMLTNKKYLGDEYYPSIIDKHTFELAHAEKLRRAQMLGRIQEPKKKEDVAQSLHFTVPNPTQLYDDPFKQAEYAYSLIESEVTIDGDE
jgi:hypothetical protein